MTGADNLVSILYNNFIEENAQIVKTMIFLRWVTPTDATASLSLAPNPESHSQAWLQISNSKAFN